MKASVIVVTHAGLKQLEDSLGSLGAYSGRTGVEVVLVSSGAVAEGMMRLGWSKRPAALYEQQAAAARCRSVLGLEQTGLTRFVGIGGHQTRL